MSEIKLPPLPIAGLPRLGTIYYNAEQMQAYARAAVALNAPTQTSAARDVLAERQRQIEAEGWTPEHDDQHTDGSLAIAAACYAIADRDGRAEAPPFWPWALDWWKPADDRRMLVKAGALILAEIERLDRAAALPAGREAA
jgi:hypothetical protein